MKYVLLVSHGTYAPGLKAALSMLFGSGREDLISVGLEDGMGADVFAEKVKNAIAPIKKEDEIILLADLIGGSPLTTAANVIAGEGLMDKTVMIGGMNLPLALNVMLMKDTAKTEGLVDQIIPEAQAAIRRFTIEPENNEDEI